jgi:hypothetical protein
VLNRPRMEQVSGNRHAPGLLRANLFSTLTLRRAMGPVNVRGVERIDRPRLAGPLSQCRGELQS